MADQRGFNRIGRQHSEVPQASLFGQSNWLTSPAARETHAASYLTSRQREIERLNNRARFRLVTSAATGWLLVFILRRILVSPAQWRKLGARNESRRNRYRNRRRCHRFVVPGDRWPGTW